MSVNTIKICLLALISIVAIIAAMLIEPIPQDSSYHEFADQRVIFGINNFINVFSNIAFCIVGIYCLWVLRTGRSEISQEPSLQSYLFFIGLILTGLGSGFYHLQPDNLTLIFDRLPMTISFMALFSFIIKYCLNYKLGNQLLFPLLFLGITSVLYWGYSESVWQGDLRWYGLVQFLPMLLIPLILLLFSASDIQKKYIWYLLGVYVLAKITEIFDTEILIITGLISGHSLKHVFASLTGIFLLKAQSTSVLNKS